MDSTDICIPYDLLLCSSAPWPYVPLMPLETEQIFGERAMVYVILAEIDIF